MGLLSSSGIMWTAVEFPEALLHLRVNTFLYQAGWRPGVQAYTKQLLYWLICEVLTWKTFATHYICNRVYLLGSSGLVLFLKKQTLVPPDVSQWIWITLAQTFLHEVTSPDTSSILASIHSPRTDTCLLFASWHLLLNWEHGCGLEFCLCCCFSLFPSSFIDTVSGARQ